MSYTRTRLLSNSAGDFKRGELRRAVMDALRQAEGPLTTRQLAVRVHATKGVSITPDKIGKERINRVRGVCKKLANVKCETGPDGVAVWSGASR